MEQLQPTESWAIARKTENTGFTCSQCGAHVDALWTGSCRNHCPHCLWSRHVDNLPGDRAAACGGAMEPVGVDYRAPKGFVVVHRCQRCRLERRNKAAPDDVDALIELMREAQASASADREVPPEAVASSASIEAELVAAARLLGLTARESEILAYVARGKTNREIGEMLWIAPTTVRRHLENIYTKLGVHTRTSAVTRALSGAAVTRGTA